MSLTTLARRMFRLALAPHTHRRPQFHLSVTRLEERDVPYAISGTVYYDTNSDGIQNNNESTASGVAVSLMPAGGTVQNGQTDSCGHYAFVALDAGTYTVTFTAPSGYSVGTPVGGTAIITLPEADVSQHAGLLEITGGGTSPPPVSPPPVEPPTPGTGPEPNVINLEEEVGMAEGGAGCTGEITGLIVAGDKVTTTSALYTDLSGDPVKKEILDKCMAWNGPSALSVMLHAGWHTGDERDGFWLGA